MTTDTHSLKKINIALNGRNYTVHCSANEEPTLLRAEKALTALIQDIRKQSPQLENDEIFMLCALNWYEQVEQLSAALEREQNASNAIQNMLEVLQNVQSNAHP